MKIVKLVPRVICGEGAFDNLSEVLESHFDLSSGYVVYIIDSVHQRTGLKDRIKSNEADMVIEADVSQHEPKTTEVDAIRDKILLVKGNKLPAVVVGIGGGSTLDMAKAVSVILTNPGSSAEYQGWDLPKNSAVPKVGVPTLSGTGSEASRTAVLTGPEKKMGINSDQSIFNVILLDPILLKTVERSQEFYTGMDCFVHCVESLSGSFINEMGKSFASAAKKRALDFFSKDKNYESLMTASYLGGCSIAMSEVGICHALSYGLSLVLNYRHGLAICLAFNQLGDYYGEDVKIFKQIMEANNIKLPTGITSQVAPDMMDRMVEMALRMEKPLTNALGDNWKEILTRDKIVELYRKM